MAERPKLLDIIVEDVASGNTEKGNKPFSSSFRYTQPILQSTLQLIGCKARHAFKISKRVFEILREEIPFKVLERNGSVPHEFPRHEFSRHVSDSEIDTNIDYFPEDIKKAAEENEIRLKEITKKLYDVQRKRSTLVLSRDDFMDVVCDAMSEYRYMGPNQRNDFALACKIREKKASVMILLCGTSGCGKSTLSTLLASRLGITTVVSTDSIRHMMRSFVDEKENPLLWASTYCAGEHLDPVAVAEAKAKKKAKEIATRLVNSQLESSLFSRAPSNGRKNIVMQHAKEHSLNAEIDTKGKSPVRIEGNITDGSIEVSVSSKMMAVQGYKAQSEMVIDSLDRLITSWEQKCESVIVEGVHLSLNFVMGLVKKHPSIIPFMIFIANEDKHLERFSVRAKYMTLDPAKNKYVKYIRNIRAIQDYQFKRAGKHRIPKVNNTNMDRSVASIHATIFACLRRGEGGEPYYDEATNTVKMVDEEYKNQCAANSLGSKGMLQVIWQRGSSCQLMALMNTDGSVAKAWPFETADIAKKLAISNINGEENLCSMYNYRALEVSPVNLQFGNFGLSAWPNDMGGTSYNGSIDGLSTRGDGTDYQSSHRSSRYGSSCSSSPRLVEGTDKELVNESRVSGSDEEQEEEVLDFDSEEELNDGREQQLEEMAEGSVDDRSIGSDGEDDYAATTDQEDDIADDGRLDMVECINRTIFRLASENGHKSHKLLDQDLSSANYVCPLNEVDRTQHSILPSVHSQVKEKEANGKHLHGRSKSLPSLTATLSSFWDNSSLIESTKRV